MDVDGCKASNSEPGHAPNQHPEPAPLRTGQILSFNLEQLRVHFHLPLPKHLLSPQLLPALRAVTEHRDAMGSGGTRLDAESLLRAPSVHAEDDRTGLGGQERRDTFGELELFLLGEEMEERRRVDRRQPPVQRIQRSEACYVGKRVGRWTRRDRRRREERVIKRVSRQERNRERLRRVLEQFVSNVPEL